MTRLLRNRAQLVIVLTLPLIGVLLGIGVARVSLDTRWLLLGLMGIVSLGFVRLREKYASAAVLMVVSSLLANFYRYRVAETSAIFSIGLLFTSATIGGWLIHLAISPQKRAQVSPYLIIPSILFIIVNILSFGWSIILRDPLVIPWAGFEVIQLLSLGLTGLLILIPIYVGTHIKDERWLRLIIGVICFCGISANIAYFSGQDFLIRFIQSGTFGIFSAWFGAIALSLVLFHKRVHPFLKWVLLFSIVTWFFRSVVINTRWISGWFPMAIALGVVLWRRMGIGVILPMIAFVILIGLQWDAVYQSVVIGNIEEGSGRRLDLWGSNIAHVTRHPLFGSGPAGYVLYNRSYESEYSYLSTHNNYFDVLLQTGIIGFSIFMWLLASIFRISVRTVRLTEGRGDFLEAVSIGIFAGWVAACAGMMLGDWVLPFAYNQTIFGFDNSMIAWVLTGCLIPLLRLAQQADGLTETAGVERDA